MEGGVKYTPRIDRGIFGPKGCLKRSPRRSRRVLEIVNNKEVQDKLVEGGFVPNPMNGADTAKYIMGSRPI